METSLTKVKQILVDKLGVDVDEVRLDATIDDLKCDSLDGTEIMMELEKEFTIHIDDSEAAPIRTVRDLVALVDSKTK